MVNILLVSHSHKLAQGTVELIRQMAPSEEVKIRVAAGIGDDNSEIGTNAVEIMEALSELAQEDGCLVMMDLGSALLSTEMALQMLDEEVTSKVKMCPAPFVEGAIAAGVQANLGSSLQEVYDEAMNSLAAKRQQILGEEAEAPLPAQTFAAEPEATEAGDAAQLQVTVTNPTGLHARPAATFIQTVKKFDAKLTVTNKTNNTEPVLVKGMISVMLLAAKQGDVLLLNATGPERQALIEALHTLFKDNFGE